jgi:hypothetical protein
VNKTLRAACTEDLINLDQDIEQCMPWKIAIPVARSYPRWEPAIGLR